MSGAEVRRLLLLRREPLDGGAHGDEALDELPQRQSRPGEDEPRGERRPAGTEAAEDGEAGEDEERRGGDERGGGGERPHPIESWAASAA